MSGNACFGEIDLISALVGDMGIDATIKASKSSLGTSMQVNNDGKSEAKCSDQKFWLPDRTGVTFINYVDHLYRQDPCVLLFGHLR